MKDRDPARASSGHRVRRGACALVVAGLASVLGACAAPGGGGPEALRAEARGALQRNDAEAAFTSLKRMATEYPDAPETRAVFPDACLLAKKLYFTHRLEDLRSPYATTELDFLFGWLARYYEDGVFPEAETNTLFGGFPGDVFQRFQGYAASDPRYAGWTFRMQDDNGVIYSVVAERAGVAASR